MTNFQLVKFVYSHIGMKKTEYNRIKIVLVEKKKTNKELAAFLKNKPETVSRWCTNDSQPNIATLFKIAKFLGVKAATLLVDQD